MTVHVGPDGDALGAMLALRHGLLNGFSHFETMDCYMEGPTPHAYRFIPGVDCVQDVLTNPPAIETYDLAISLDCGSADRLGANQKHFDAAKISVNIDHHISNDYFGTQNIVLTGAAASGEVVADILDYMNIPLTTDCATCIYTALATDTGGFKFSNATSKAYRLGANCIEAGANHELVYKQLYENLPKAQTLLLADAVQHAQFSHESRMAWTLVTQDMLKRNNAKPEHTDGIVDALRQIDSVILAAVFKESDEGVTRVSLRSDNHNLDVSAIAGQFGGGGHKMASGCTIEAPIQQASAELLKTLQTALETILKVENAQTV